MIERKPKKDKRIQDDLRLILDMNRHSLSFADPIKSLAHILSSKKKHPSCGTLDQKGSKEGQRRGDFIKKAILKRICSLFSLKKERDGQGNPGT